MYFDKKTSQEPCEEGAVLLFPHITEEEQPEEVQPEARRLSNVTPQTVNKRQSWGFEPVFLAFILVAQHSVEVHWTRNGSGYQKTWYLSPSNYMTLEHLQN